MCGTVTELLMKKCMDSFCPKECHTVFESEIKDQDMLNYFGRNSLPEDVQARFFDPGRTQSMKPYQFDGEKTQPIGVLEEH